ncbi:coiled-coil domain-containing protein 178 isoform X1 [Salmo salar]|uniref:Coiled-coil domain-containing protein 178 isoform X1 n=2 Tax=Salmo salar TaxID=8030 RepID=A0A1S3LXL9_SALSA|nr:coiled-coil domain-containing protein 178 isoform X1 [Salmo salar]
MPEVEPLRFPSREDGPSLQDQVDLQAVCPSRRRSCALVNTPSPCVNKAVCHIQELKRKVENWCQQSGNVQHQMSHEEQQKRKTFRLNSSESVSSMIPTELYIEGIGLSARGEREGDLLSPLRKETTDVLVEVVYLIERLEADRQDAEEALQSEKKRRRTLGRKMYSISLWKQQEFPVAVQKEHEACTRDISELKWHLKLRRDKLHQVTDRMIKTEVLNQRLNEDIDFIKKNGPLVKEKLQLESDFMIQINTAQHKALETFSKTFSELKSCQEEMRKEELKADEDRGLMFNKLKGIRNLLNDRLTEFQQLIDYWDGYCITLKETEERVALKEEEWGDMSQRIPVLEVQEAAVNDLVVELNIFIEDEGRKIAQLKEEISELQKEVHATRLAGEASVSHSEEVFCKKHQDILALHEENKEYELETEDYSNMIYESEQAVKQLQKERKRMLQKISVNEEQREEAKEELSQVAAMHANTKVNLEELEQQTFMEEQRMRKVIENLKKDMMSEMKAKAILKETLTTFKAELHQEQTNTENARWELHKEFEEVSSATKQLEIEMEKLRKIYNDKSEKIERLREKLCDILNEHKNTANCLKKERNLKLDHLNTAKELHQDVTKRFDHALSRITVLTAKSKEYRTGSDRMEETAATMPDVIEELQSVFDAVEFKNQTATLIMNTLERDITNCQQRIEQAVQTHTSLFTTRQQKMEETKSDLKVALRENVELAHEYRALQKVLMIAKQGAVGVFDERNRAEASFYDHKQISLLQKRMHKAVVKYFRQRNLYSQAELARFQTLNNENNQKIKTVQEELSEAIRRISAFLHSLADDSTTSDDAATMETAAVNKQAGLDAIGLNKKKMPTVQITV